MKRPISSLHKMTSSYPVLWGSLVFLIGSGFELLATQKMLGTRVLYLILSKLDLFPQGQFMTFLYHGLTMLVGLLLLAAAVHAMAMMMKSKGGFLRFLAILLFVTGLMSMVSTIVTLIRHDQPGLEWLTIATSSLSFALCIGTIREVYKLPWGHSLLAGGFPVLVVSLWVSV